MSQSLFLIRSRHRRGKSQKIDMRLIISVILLVAALAVLFFWGRTLWEDIQGLRTEVKAYESVLSRLNQLKKTRDDLLASYKSIPASDLKKIKNFLPETPNAGPFVTQMANMANQNGLLLKNINIGITGEKSADFSTSISVSGSYRNFIKFLSEIEKSLRLIDVVKLSFSSSREDFYDFSLEAKSYFQK